MGGADPQKFSVYSAKMTMQTKGECFMFGLMPYERRERGMMDLFNDLDKYFFGDKSMPSMPALSCRTDIEDRGDSYLLSAELPGFSKEDIRLDLDGDVLTISAAHSEMCIRDSSSPWRLCSPAGRRKRGAGKP